MSDDLSGDMLAPSWPNLVIGSELLVARCHGRELNVNRNTKDVGSIPGTGRYIVAQMTT